MAEKYVGTLISLVTKSDIRYEGFVFKINIQDSTLTLRNVKSLGTEGRRKDGSQVPPSEGVYKYINFKGTDIKDLHVKSSAPAQSTFDVPDDPAIVQSYLSPPTSSSPSLSTSGALQKTNISQNAQSAAHTPSSQGNDSLRSSIAVPLGSALSPLTLDDSKPAISTSWQGFHHLPSISQGLIASHPTQQQTNSSLMNEHLATNPPFVVQPYHTLIPPISHGAQNGLHGPQKSPVCSLSGVPSMVEPSATGSQNGFPPMSPGFQNDLRPMLDISTISSPTSLPSTLPPSDASSPNGFPPVPPLSATYSMISHERPCSQNSLQPVGPFSAICSSDGLPSLPSSSVTSSGAGFPPLPPSPTNFLRSPLTPGSQSGLQPMPLLSVTGYSDALHSLSPSSASVNGFSLSTSSPMAHSDAGLFSTPAISSKHSLRSNITFSSPGTPANLNQVASSSSTSPHVNTFTTSVEEVALPVSAPVAPCSSMPLSLKQITETCIDITGSNPIQPSHPLLQEEPIQLPSSHSSRIINDYNSVQVSASVTLSSGLENVKEPLHWIEKTQDNKVQGATASSRNHKTYHCQRPRDEDRDGAQGRHSYRGFGIGRAKLGRHGDRRYGKGRAKFPNGAVLFSQYGYKTHAKPRGHMNYRDGSHGGHSDQGCEKGRGNLASHRNKTLGGDHRSSGFVLSTRRLGRGYPSGVTKAVRPVKTFTEDFNFEAMNEKFNKEKVWGILGERTLAESEHKNGDGDTPEAVEDGPVKVDNKPVYCKDDFFDTLSSNTVDQQTGKGRVKLSERRRVDSETFGEIKKHQRGRGIQGPLRAGGSEGSYRGRGYDNSGRGRERTVWSPVT